MNTVPFDQLGPGQSGRLAYQVLGQDGPIFNRRRTSAIYRQKALRYPSTL